MKQLTLAAFVAVAAAVSFAPGAMAEFPEQDIRVVVPWGAGGGVDGITRKFMSIAEKTVSATIYVENIEGGISSIGVSEVMKARPDGYTLGALTYDSLITVPWKQLLPGYDIKKLRLLARVTSEPNALIVGKGKYASFEEFIAAAKAAPGTLTIGVHGLGSMPHLSMLQLQDETGAEFRAVSYPDGAAGQKEGLLSGEIDAAITSLGDFASLLEADQAVGLVEFSDTRNPTYSDVPLSADVGLQMKTGSFMVLAAPAGTPEDVISKLDEGFKKAFDTEDFQNWTKQVGVTASWAGADEVTAWAEETQRSIFATLDDLVAKGVIEK